MRPILAFTILLIGASSAGMEPEYSALFAEQVRADPSHGGPALVEIETSTARADRLAVAAEQTRALSVAVYRPEITDASLILASASLDIEANAGTEASRRASRGSEVSMDDLCTALFTSAQDNDLPIPFFANLIWQESRLRPDDVSKKGAQGIAQFMPEVASEKGLANPFDPMQAIPASARFLRELRLQFGNLGFVAAAYNAGAHRVADWLEHRGSLPRETRDYVVRVTGLSVEAWRDIPVDNGALTFVQPLPCRSLPAFANVEQAQSQEAELEEEKLDQAVQQEPDAEDDLEAEATPPQSTEADRGAAKHDHGHAHEAQRKHEDHKEQRVARRAGREHHIARREAEHTRVGREKRKSA